MNEHYAAFWQAYSLNGYDYKYDIKGNFVTFCHVVFRFMFSLSLAQVWETFYIFLLFLWNCEMFCFSGSINSMLICLFPHQDVFVGDVKVWSCGWFWKALRQGKPVYYLKKMNWSVNMTWSNKDQSVRVLFVRALRRNMLWNSRSTLPFVVMLFICCLSQNISSLSNSGPKPEGFKP